MRLGIVSDIHCNADALSLALERMGDVDELLCAGDAVFEYRFSFSVSLPPAPGSSVTLTLDAPTGIVLPFHSTDSI